MASFDGFSPGDENAYVAFTPERADHWLRYIERLGRAIGAEVEGMDHLPEGPGLLVANHAFGWDVALPMAAIRRATGRTVWALGEHLWWQVPFLRRIASEVGVVDGTKANVDALLSRGELVLVLPGGMREAVKPRELRYRLLWGHRYGFVRAAVRHQAPLVPMACLGADDLFDFVGDAYSRGRRWVGARIPIPLPSRILPIPHLARVRYVIGEPVRPTLGREHEDDTAALHALRRQIGGALHELIDHELARRIGVETG